MYKAWNPFARLPTSPSKRILMLAPVAVGSGSSRLHHRLPIAAGLTGKNSFDDGTSRDKDRTRVAPHENIRNNNIQIGNLMPCSHRWVRGFHVLTGGRYLIWCQPRRRHLWLYTTTLIPTLSVMPTISPPSPERHFYLNRMSPIWF